METSANNPSIVKTASLYGLYLGLTLCCVTLICYLLNYYPDSFGAGALLFILSIGIYISFIVWSTKKYRMQIGGYISYSKALLFGILVVVFAGILSSVCTALLHMFDPSYTQNMIDASIRLIERMNIPEVQIEAARAKVVAQMESTYSNPFLAILNGLQGSLIFGLILCLITSIFTRKAKPMDFQ